MYPACVMQRPLVVLPATHEMVFVEVFEFGGLQNLPTVRQRCKVELFQTLFDGSEGRIFKTHLVDEFWQRQDGRAFGAPGSGSRVRRGACCLPPACQGQPINQCLWLPPPFLVF